MASRIINKPVRLNQAEYDALLKLKDIEDHSSFSELVREILRDRLVEAGLLTKTRRVQK